MRRLMSSFEFLLSDEPITSLTISKTERLDDRQHRSDSEERGSFFHLFGYNPPATSRDDRVDLSEHVGLG